ncbi:hypothetical protein GMES_4130 [Paraglaciecola mesophila KMM 241]|uniref:Uncharacterized protein n=1 Tax=Paraglaciecola mesophila KMM 241 TaxID=1128912 RepID=K6ZBQ9_9ALTE|nr:hypothetical protein GMES_4130 [Paraglaciecola mesophila KMM 241]
MVFTRILSVEEGNGAQIQFLGKGQRCKIRMDCVFLIGR